MKISNLSLAILIALGTAACGGSGSSDNKPADPPKPGNPNTPAPSNPNADASALPKIVDPTQTQVVDNKDLGKVESVGTLQYIRRDGSNYDKSFNPSQPASASPFLGVHLDDQNPKLTNIVLARQNLQRADGQPVKAQFTGSTNSEPLNTDGSLASTQVTTDGNASLQRENFTHVNVLGGAFETYDAAVNKKLNQDGTHKANTLYKDKKFQIGDADGTEIKRLAAANADGIEAFNKKTGLFNKLTTTDFDDADAKKAFPSLVAANQTTPQQKLDTVTAVRVSVAPKDSFKETYNNAAVYLQFHANKYDAADPTKSYAGTGIISAADVTGADEAYDAAASKAGTIDSSKRRRYGGNLVWWSSPNDAFENIATRKGSGFAVNAADATTGLVRIGGGLDTLGQELNWNSSEGKWEDHHNTTTRIFGRYHLAFANTDKNRVDPVALNTFVGASTFVSAVELPKPNAATEVAGSAAHAINNLNYTKAKSYSIGAVPGHLENVQYGRVTTNLDLELDAKTYGDGFMHAPYRAKNDDGSVDNYFYRGINATTVAEMAALPTDKKLTYHGHALMYGIDNNYHGAGNSNLPNAFAYGSDGLGLGNFVEATADLATKKLTGTVYNAWLLDQSKAAVTKDVLVNFSGNIVGNSAFGSADRAYLAGEDKADFRASFFGDKAEELGGSFNSVHSIPSNGTAQAYGSAYGAGDWGGVFGAKQAGSGNTFQGDDGANVYTGLGN